MKFIMIVVITSWAPVRALSRPGMAPQIAPPRAPASSARGTWRYTGTWIENPTNSANIPPTSSWP